MPTRPTSPADLTGQHRRQIGRLTRAPHDRAHYIGGDAVPAAGACDRPVFIAAAWGASTTGPGAEQKRHELAEWHARREFGCEGWPGALPGDEPAPTDAALRYAGDVARLSVEAARLAKWQAEDDSRAPAQGYALPDRPLRPLALVLIGYGLGTLGAMLIWHAVARLAA